MTINLRGNQRASKTQNSLGDTTKQYIYLLVYYLLLVYLILDSINGFLLRNSFPISITQPYKILLLFLMLTVIFISSIKKTIYVYLTSLVLAAPSLLTIVAGKNVAHIGQDISMSLKILMFFVGYYFFSIAFADKTRYFDKKRISIIFKVNLSVLVLNLVLGTMGLGFSKYSNNVGTVGFFYSGNEVSGLSVVFFSIMSIVIYNKHSIKKYLFFSLLMMLLSLFLSTKVAILATFLIVVLIPIVNEREKIYSLTKTKIKYTASLIVLLPFLIYSMYYGVVQSGLMNRLFHFYERLDLLTFILSMRNVSAAYAWDSFVNDFSFSEVLFGKGYRAYYEYFNAVFGPGKTVEIDFFDVLMMYGFLGSSLIYGFWITITYRSYQAAFVKNGHFFAPAVFLMNSLLLLISLTAGHIVYSALLALFFTLFNGLISTRSKLQSF